MNEVFIGYLEAALLVMGSITSVLILLRTFARSRDAEMADHAAIPFREGQDGHA
jgi:hypothetical protein